MICWSANPVSTTFAIPAQGFVVALFNRGQSLKKVAITIGLES